MQNVTQVVTTSAVMLNAKAIKFQRGSRSTYISHEEENKLKQANKKTNPKFNVKPKCKR